MEGFSCLPDAARMHIADIEVEINVHQSVLAAKCHWHKRANHLSPRVTLKKNASRRRVVIVADTISPSADVRSRKRRHTHTNWITGDKKREAREMRQSCIILIIFIVALLTEPYFCLTASFETDANDTKCTRWSLPLKVYYY